MSNGDWTGDPSFAYVWEDCDSTGTVCSPIDGATSSSYTLQASDVGSTIVALVTASNPDGQNSAMSAAVGPVLPAAPVNSTLPEITGTAQQGDTLSVSNGDWSGDPSYAYVWEDCDSTGTVCSPIDGAASSSYTLQASDVGSTIVALVTASNPGGQNSAMGAAVGPVLPAAPVETSPPVISGTVQQGDALSVSTGAWSNDPANYTYSWEDCDSTGTVCAPIGGATSSSYTLQPSDVGEYVSATVTASNSGGQASATSAIVGAVLPTAPADNTAPGISGTAQQGDTLTASHGDWSNNPTGYSYAWQDCDNTGNNCATIAGATSSSYTLQASDVGFYVSATVTASNAGGQTSATIGTADPVLPAAPVDGSAPLISGAAQQADALSVSKGSWSNNPTGYSYAWQDCDDTGNNCATIAGATSSSYTLRASDVGSTIVAVVTASNSGGQNSAMTAAVGPVLPAAPVDRTAPVISGTAQQGKTVSVSTGGWSNSPTGYGYAWQDCNSSGTACSPISGATSSSYTLQPSDVGAYVSATVTASNSGGQASATSAIVGAVLPAAPADSTAPGISGTAQQGDTLTASHGVWSNSPTAYSYAWKDCDGSGNNCAPIAGATSNTYRLTAADVGSYVSVTVTAMNSGGQASVTSAPSGLVLPPAPVNTKAPAITGSPQQGDTLSVNNGTWSNSPTGFSYAWEGCSSGNCSPIPGATSSSYTLSAADIGTTIVCVVTANGPGGSASASSKNTGAVAAAPTPPASQPTTTALLSSPTAPVTNQGVTLIATVTSVTSGSTALWGAVTFEDSGRAIGGCVNMPVTPSGQSATVACSTSFAASAAQLTAVFTPATGSVLKGSVSPADAITVGADSSATLLDVSPSVNVGSSTTYTASVAPPAARPGPVEPTGSVEFLDGGQPIGSCAGQPLTNGQATCTVTYTASGQHQVTARYAGDANFTGSSSPTEPLSAVPVPVGVAGTITSTMQWAFYYTPSYTRVRNLVVNGVFTGSTVLVKCHGLGCPFLHHATVLTKRARCGKKTQGMCLTYGSFVITPGFARQRLGLGSRVTVEIIRQNWVGKYYSFTVRARRGPRIQIGCLAPGGSVPGQGC